MGLRPLLGAAPAYFDFFRPRPIGRVCSWACGFSDDASDAKSPIIIIIIIIIIVLWEIAFTAVQYVSGNELVSLDLSSSS